MKLITFYEKLLSMLKPIPDENRAEAYKVMLEDSFCEFIDFCVEKGCFNALQTDQIPYYRRFILDSITMVDADPRENYFEEDLEKRGMFYDAVGITENVCQSIISGSETAIQNILDAIHEKLDAGYSEAQLEVDFGYVNGDESNEGYYLSKLNGWGATPITEILAHDGDFDEDKLIEHLDHLGLAHCLS